MTKLIESEVGAPSPGLKIVNGVATVVSAEQRQNYYIVLAVREHEDEPFVTWAYSPVDGECFWGHYHASFNEAYADFRERVAG